MSRSLFDKYGGFGPISRVVMDFYDRVLENDTLAPFFDGVDMSKQIDHQTVFFASLMGGPASHSNEALRQVHAHLDISDAVFQELAEVLRETLEDFDFEDNDVDAVMQEISTRKPFILGN